MQQYGLSQRKACRALELSRSVYAYQPDMSADDEVIVVLQELAERFPERGFSKYFKVIRRRGHGWNHKRVYRIYCALKLNHRRIGKKRLPPRTPSPLAVPGRMNQNWSMDFMSDALWNGRRFRTFNVVDDFNREILAIEIDLNLPAARVIRVLERIVAWRGYPAKVRMDNGPEFIPPFSSRGVISNFDGRPYPLFMLMRPTTPRIIIIAPAKNSKCLNRNRSVGDPTTRLSFKVAAFTRSSSHRFLRDIAIFTVPCLSIQVRSDVKKSSFLTKVTAILENSFISDRSVTTPFSFTITTKSQIIGCSTII